MANNKLQELTEQLFSEGLAKGKAEGEKMVEDARKKAEEIIAQAKAEAERTINDAQKKAADILSKADSDVRMASSQALDATKKDIQELILAKSADTAVEKVLGSEAFAKEVISAVAKAFSTEKACDLAMVLPESCKGGVEDYVRTEVSKAIGKGIDVQLSKKIKGGLQIGPKDGTYYISLSDETFKDMIKTYLRPATRKILFGE